MRPLSTPSAAARASALEATLEQLDRLDRLAESPLARIPGAAMMVLDAGLRVRLMLGSAWEEMGVDPARCVGRPLVDCAPRAASGGRWSTAPRALRSIARFPSTSACCAASRGSSR